MESFRSFVVNHYCQPLGMGAFSRDFTTNLALQCRSLKIENLKAPLSPRGCGTQMTGALDIDVEKIFHDQFQR